MLGGSLVVAQDEILVGDMNDDGQLTVGDVTQLTNTVIGKSPQRTISTRCDPNVSVPAALAGSWKSEDGGRPLVLNADGSVALCPVSGVTHFEYYPFRRLLVLLDADDQVARNYLVVRKGDESLALQPLEGGVTQHQLVTLVESLSFDATYLALQRDEEHRIKATILPADATDTTLKWHSSNKGVADVSEDGVITTFSFGACTITAFAKDGSEVSATCHVVVTCPHEYVDLGLPSGRLWATCNVGASSPEERGGFFTWGQTEPTEYISDSNWENTHYFDRTPNGTFKKYNDKNKTELDLEDDAAYMNWGPEWRMPTTWDFAELATFTDITEVKVNGVLGARMQSRSSNKYIFLPYNSSYLFGNYWSRTKPENIHEGAYSFSTIFMTPMYSMRYNTYGVRPVRAIQ